MTLAPRHEDLADPAVGQDLAVGAADLDFHAGDGLAAIDDRAVAARTRFVVRRAPPDSSFSSTSSSRMPSPGGISETASVASARP